MQKDSLKNINKFYLDELLLLSLFAIVLWVICYTLGGFEIVDERQHLIQIRKYLIQDYPLNPELTTLPGYHFLTAQLSLLFNISSLSSLRFINSLYSILLYIGIWFYLKNTPPSFPKIQTWQLVATPILWPFMWLIYTDILAIALVLGMAILVKRRHYILAALCGILALSVRQPNIVWVIFFWLMALYQENFFAIFQLQNYSRQRNLKSFMLATWIKFSKTIPFLIPIIIFIAFVYYNKGIAVGDSESHQFGKLYPTQIYFLLLILWIALLPLHIANIRKIILAIRQKPWIISLSIGAIFAIYLVTFEVSHRYNIGPSHYFFRNWLLNAMNDVLSIKLLAFPLIVWVALSLLVTQFKSKEMYWLYPFTIASLLPVSLIEQRYYMISFVLLMLFRVPLNRKVELALLAWLSILSFFLTRSIYSGRHFL